MNVPCYQCKVAIPMTAEVNEMLIQSHRTFYCIWGHPNVYIQGESEADKLRREGDRLKQSIAEKDDAIARARTQRDEQAGLRQTAERSAAAYRGQVTKIKRRVGNGTCPCCNRTFVDLARHMAGQHPTFAAEDVTETEGAVH